ncbi:maleylpyruvate isomerase family mycothiol-dependent enzyme [Catellatospora methionotrophica]|uniref:maleylpyruvate isomerase family mycothiol-dependent enzyme n=1 Tax=Catellatospora methionotrophica TaxID=121620 RepID=UPI0033F52461
MSAHDRAAAACRHSLHALATIGDQLTDDQWSVPTDCPGWTVGDVYAHVVSLEQWMADGGEAPQGPPQQLIDSGVDRWRGTARTEVLAALHTLRQVRERQLTAELRAADAPGWWVWANTAVPFAVQLSARAFDLWVHEQDVRRALRHPGNLGAAGAQVARDLVLQALPRIVVKKAGAAPGAAMRITTLGELPQDFTVYVDEHGRAAVLPADAHRSTAHATLSWEAYALLASGRSTRERQQVLLTGDAALAERVLDQLNIAP